VALATRACVLRRAYHISRMVRLSDDEVWAESALRRGLGGKGKSAAALGMALGTVNRVRAGKGRGVSVAAFRGALLAALRGHPEWFAWYPAEGGVRGRLLGLSSITPEWAAAVAQECGRADEPPGGLQASRPTGAPLGAERIIRRDE
jgi:hypothetical protein